MLIMILSYYIKTMEKALAPETRPASLPFLAIKKITVHYRPRPVVGIIAPWNFPVANAMMDGIGALAAGCAVLLKPSERTPLTAEVLVRGWRAVAGPTCSRWRRVPAKCPRPSSTMPTYVQFTGSSATGRKVMERAARRLTPVSLELGGKDPMIVLEDADVDLAAHAAVWGGDVQRRPDVRVGRAGLRARVGLRRVRRRGGARRRGAEGRRRRGLHTSAR